MIGVFYTERVVRDGFAGAALGPLIFIRPAYRDDAGLLAHELVHRRQWIKSWGLHSFRYSRVASYRLACEVEAYREQMLHCAEDRSCRFAEFLATKYDLVLTLDEAHRLLSESIS